MDAKLSKRELLRQKRKEQKRRKYLTFLFITIGAIALFTLAVVLPKILMEQNKYSSSRGFSLGDPDAPVTVVQFSNYSCGFCKDFSERVEDNFIADYVETGEVYYRYVNISSNNAQSQKAAEASYCAADQNRFFEYKDLLYTYSSATDGFSFNNLVNYAASIGLDTEAFQSCLERGTYANAYIEDFQYAQSIGITGTPTFLVNDQLVSSSELIPAVDALLLD